MSEETKAKISVANKGKPKSAAHRAALSRAKTGSKQSQETIAKRVASVRRTISQKKIHRPAT